MDDISNTTISELLIKVNFLTLLITGILLFIVGLILYFNRTKPLISQNMSVLVPLPPQAVGSYVFCFNLMKAFEGQLPSPLETFLQLIEFLGISIFFLFLFVILTLFTIYIQITHCDQSQQLEEGESLNLIPLKTLDHDQPQQQQSQKLIKERLDKINFLALLVTGMLLVFVGLFFLLMRNISFVSKNGQLILPLAPFAVASYVFCVNILKNFEGRWPKKEERSIIIVGLGKFLFVSFFGILFFVVGTLFSIWADAAINPVTLVV